MRPQPGVELSGAVAVVTGAGSGIGRAIATALVAQGATVMLADIDVDRLAVVGAELAAFGRVASQVVDVTDPAALDSLAMATDDRFGPPNVVVNNAGIVRSGPAWELDLADWHRVIDVNLWGVVHGIRSFVPRMLAAGRAGHIVNVGSMASVGAYARIAPYAASKHAVLAVSDSVRLDLAALGAPIRVSTVFPGLTNTAMTGAGSPATVVSDAVIEAIRDGVDYVFPHPERIVDASSRFDRIVGR